MDDEEILAEAMYFAEGVAEILEGIHLPTKEIELCKSGIVPPDTWRLRNQLITVNRQLTAIVVKIDEWKETFPYAQVERGELLFKRHMESLITAIREIRSDVNEARNFLRSRERTPLIDDRPDYVKRNNE